MLHTTASAHPPALTPATRHTSYTPSKPIPHHVKCVVAASNPDRATYTAITAASTPYHPRAPYFHTAYTLPTTAGPMGPTSGSSSAPAAPTTPSVKQSDNNPAHTAGSIDDSPYAPNSTGITTPAEAPTTATHTTHTNVATTPISAPMLHDLNTTAAVAAQATLAAIYSMKHVGAVMRGKIPVARIGTADSRTAALARSGRPYMPRTRFSSTRKRRGLRR